VARQSLLANIAACHQQHRPPEIGRSWCSVPMFSAESPAAGSSLRPRCWHPGGMFIVRPSARSLDRFEPGQPRLPHLDRGFWACPTSPSSPPRRRPFLRGNTSPPRPPASAPSSSATRHQLRHWRIILKATRHDRRQQTGIYISNGKADHHHLSGPALPSTKPAHHRGRIGRSTIQTDPAHGCHRSLSHGGQHPYGTSPVVFVSGCDSNDRRTLRVAGCASFPGRKWSMRHRPMVVGATMSSRKDDPPS